MAEHLPRSRGNSVWLLRTGSLEEDTLKFGAAVDVEPGTASPISVRLARARQVGCRYLGNLRSKLLMNVQLVVSKPIILIMPVRSPGRAIINTGVLIEWATERIAPFHRCRIRRRSFGL